MNILLISMVIGILVGLIDVAPMILKKMDKRAIISAFLQYFFVSIVILNIKLPGIAWWLQGSIVSFCLALPIIVLVSTNDKKSVPIIAVMSIVLGTIISVAGYFLV